MARPGQPAVGGARTGASWWRLHEARPGQWWAVDERAGTAYEVEDRTAVELWEREDLLSLPLPAALRIAHDSGRRSGFLDLRFVGTTVRYRSDDPVVLEALEHPFSGACSRLRNSPQVVVDLGGGADVERLHRSVSGERVGVTVRTLPAGDPEPGSSKLPVLPPMQAAPLAGRYTGLHAALLGGPHGVVAVCGRQRAGKTTSAAIARRAFGALVLTDELVMLDRAGAAWGVALPVRERTAGERVSYPLAATPDGAHPVPVDHVVVLDRVPGTGAPEKPSWTRVDDTARAVQALAPHLRPLDGPLGRATSSMLSLLRRAPLWRWRLRPWPEMADDITTGLTRLTKEEQP